jgi:predicted transposase YbfD/YdcC
MIGRVASQTTRGGKVETARRCYRGSTKFTAPNFADVVRAHWGVENRLHWVLDAAFDEDQCRLRTGNGPENMSIVRHLAMNLLRTTTTRVSLKTRRIKAGWNTDYLGKVLRGAG